MRAGSVVKIMMPWRHHVTIRLSTDFLCTSSLETDVIHQLSAWTV